MQILGYYIISNDELQKQIKEAREQQRKFENSIISNLFRNSERYRQIAEFLLGKKIALRTTALERLIEKSFEKKKG